jgi:hypothetical protein
MTCDEYNTKVAAGTLKAEKKTEKIIKKIAKRCPGCQRFINKNGGCSHMSCKFSSEMLGGMNANIGKVLVGGTFVGVVSMITPAIRGLARNGCEKPSLISGFSYLYVMRVS